eukprot:scaffold6895_cov131-Isochrysis_galbana.AAC.4
MLVAGWHAPGSGCWRGQSNAQAGQVRIDVAGRTRGGNEHASGKHHGGEGLERDDACSRRRAPIFPRKTKRL